MTRAAKTAYKTRALRALGRLCNGAISMALAFFLAVVMAVGADEQIREKLRDTRGEKIQIRAVSRVSIVDI